MYASNLHHMAPPPASRRYPLTAAPASHHALNHDMLAGPKVPPKPPASPPLPRQNSKTRPPSPPKIISDKGGRLHYNRVGFLGEGGFARVYEVQDPKGNRLACKVVTKSALKTKKAKTKLYAEIKIHRSLDHPNIVTFQDCFEDDENVYITLDLCPSGSLMDMLRRRRRFSEPETRFFMVQLIGACHYMHTHQVIHRDLKLGNLFLDANMNIQVGDFGLAALIENPGERKKTICGTPNYIAPEVLFDTANGHSFEVDIWSIGVILYTLVVGRPPFQTKEVKEIYKRIRDNEYDFPPDRVVSSAVKGLVQEILTPDPSERPTLHEIIEHAFFTQGAVPAFIPTSAHDAPPDFRHITKTASEANLARLRRNSLLDSDFTTMTTPSPPAPPQQSARNTTTSIAQQEKEFQKAVLPGSPISALLSSARQPLMVGPMNTGVRESPLMRKLQSVRESPLGRRSVTRNVDGGLDEEERGKKRFMSETAEEEEEARVRKKELEAQKARIVAQMAPVKEEVEREEEEEEEAEDQRRQEEEEEEERRQAAARAVKQPRREERENIPPVPVQPAKRAARPLGLPSSGSQASLPLAPPKLNGFDAAAQILTMAFDAKAAGRVFRNPLGDDPLPEERVFIVSWVDYCNKYGMGYALTDGSVGVHFNDSTSLVLSADKAHFDYIASRRQGTVYVRKSYGVDEYPEELKSKVYLLKHFEKYIMERLYGEYEYTFEDVGRTKGMDWVQKYLRMKHVIVFKLSHDVLQFNFYDHSKLILSSHGLLITHIDKHYQMTRWTLSDVMAFSLNPPTGADAEQVKFQQRLVDKLKYCKEVLVSIKSASGAGGEEGAGEGAGAGADGMAVDVPTKEREREGPVRTAAPAARHQGGSGSATATKGLGPSRRTASKMSLR